MTPSEELAAYRRMIEAEMQCIIGDEDFVRGIARYFGLALAMVEEGEEKLKVLSRPGLPNRFAGRVAEILASLRGALGPVEETK